MRNFFLLFLGASILLVNTASGQTINADSLKRENDALKAANAALKQAQVRLVKDSSNLYNTNKGLTNANMELIDSLNKINRALKNQNLVYTQDTISAKFVTNTVTGDQIYPKRRQNLSLQVNLPLVKPVMPANLSAIDIEIDNRKMNLDFVNEMTTLQTLSTFSFVPGFSNGSYYPLKGDSGRPTFVLDIQTYPVINLAGKNWYSAREKTSRGRTNQAGTLHSLQLVPTTHIRIYTNKGKNGNTFDDHSRPVRTPSYLQGVAYYISHSKFWKRPLGQEFNWKTDGFQKRTSDSFNYENTEGEVNASTNSYYGRLKAFHFSNGQDGWDRVLPWTSGNDSLLFFQFDKETGELNTYNGDFGLNVVWEISAGFIRENTFNANDWYWINPKGKSLHVLKRVRTHAFNAGYEFFIPQLDGMALVSDNAYDHMNFYATNRINLNYTYIQAKQEQEISQANPFASDEDKKTNARSGESQWYAIQNPSLNEKFRILFDATYLLDNNYYRGNLYAPQKIKMDHIARRLNLTVTAHKRIRGTVNASAFAQVGYYGSDPYNMQFMTARYFWRIGIGWGIFRTKEDKEDF